ncbi:hypothetical protein D0469_08280 [Peribacillus saganii]|uniref:L,D-TPase catalytic domain-containing protein n=1 Tax=Peribacillus saganii TaxID=2303992 RepID=A0A372LPY2_9BACI|nr:L,D-transpeptidase family protein [Peribacillus saganii]RFU70169.1 hypothetical protein D0469_08280 [Peribacillus saganii]
MKKILVCLVLLSFLWFGTQPVMASANQLIIINKSTNQLAFYENSRMVKVFRVATGRKAAYTPEGKFKVVNKIVNRPYYKEKIPGGDPRNPLGTRWLGLNARGTWGTTYAIHGNSNPASIGKYVSSGCIRMHNEEVKWLFSKIKINTPVVITSAKKSFHSLASANGYKPIGPEAKFVNSYALKIGSRGEEVKVLQRKLNALGYSVGTVDGVFGAKTDLAVKKFQSAHKLKADGIVGAATKKALEMVWINQV